MAATALAAGAASLPSVAGQASTSFDVSITVLSAPTTCTASLQGAAARLLCTPVVAPTAAPVLSAPVVVPAAVPVLITSAGDQDGPIGLRLPDTRMRVAGALVEVGEESFRAWGEYSSRIIAAGGVEYVEMTVTW
jgi:hypothetical protein